MAEIATAKESIILASIHVPIIDGWAYPYIEEIFELIQPHIEGKRFIVGGDLNSYRLIAQVQGSKHHNAFFDRIESNGHFNCIKKFYHEEPQTFFGKQAKFLSGRSSVCGRGIERTGHLLRGHGV